MGYRKDLGRQWKLSRHLVLENFRENELEPANVRTETLTFDAVDIYHPYLAIYRGFMNNFDAVIRQ
jgi:hypothetical protein